MALTFDNISSEIEVNVTTPKEPTVADEINTRQLLLDERTTKCRPIVPVYQREKRVKPKPSQFAYKYFCVCPQYNPTYCCKHTGNVIIDRDVLTKEEHICFLATPKANFAAPRGQPKYYQKKVIVPNTTSRIVQLATPKMKRVEYTLAQFAPLLKKRHIKSLKQHLAPKPEVQYTTINQALEFIDEERRLTRATRNIQKKRCKRVQKNILRKQRKQICKIICILFEEMKDFLLNDQFLIDERSTLCTVVLEQIKKFTDNEFYTTSNLRDYQQILANNLTVWINKFISNLNIHVAPPQPKVEQPDVETFLPVRDYISFSESYEEEDVSEEQSEEDYFPAGGAEGYYDEGDYDQYTDSTLRNTN